MELTDRQMLVLAAFLHDIGKFGQRAGAGKSREMEGEYCPTKDNHPTHAHVLYSDHFIQHELPLPQELDNDHMRSRLARLAASHHKPAGDDLLEQALHVGDGLSAGADRKGGEESEGDYKSARLLSIFEQVSLQGARPFEALKSGLCHSLAPIEEAPFPVPLEQARQRSYADLFEAFRADLQRLPLDMGVSHYIASLLALLERYTWCIPSSTYKSLADISLFDHALTTAAIAQALAVYHDEQGGLPGTGRATAEKFLLFGGDLSGIQKYIFGLDKSQGSGVAKLFRARSFFLQVLTRSVMLELLDRLDLHPVARIMDAGGRFVLLLPNTPRVRELLPAFELEVQRYFFERFRGALSLNLCWQTALTEADMAMKCFKDKLDAFNDALEARKLAKFDRLFAAGISPVIETDYAVYEYGDCAICHAQPVDPDATREHQERYGHKVNLCRDCADQIRLIGQKLPHCTYLVFERAGQGGVALFGGQTLRLVENIDRAQGRQALEIVNIRRRGEFAYQPVAAHLPRIDADDLARWQSWGVLKEDADNRPCYREEPVMEGEPKTFALLALTACEIGADDKPVGRAFLGAFKADVDNLGLLFGIGLQNRLSISRFASLSRMINFFFSEDLVAFMHEQFPDLYLVFAGGDDLFLLGPWSQVVRFAGEMRERFARFVARRPEITLSAGVAVVKPTLPMHAIADQAESLLEAAKHRCDENGVALKDGVTLFDTTVGWDEFGELIATGDWLHDLAENEAIPRGLLGRLLYYGKEHRAFRAGDMRRGIYLSHMAYDFARNLKEKNLPDAKQRSRLLDIRQNEFLLRNMRIPASYALYRLRREG